MTVVRRLLGSWWFRGSAAALVLIIAGGIAGWWFFIREDAELATSAPDPRSFSSETPDPAATETGAPGSATAAATPATPLPAGTTKYTVDSENSFASYFAGETLASIGLPSTAQGTTEPVTGAFYLTATGLDSNQKSSFAVDLRNFKSSESRRDQRVQQALETARFPTATFVATRIDGFPAAFSETDDAVMTMTGRFTLHGVEKEVTWEVRAKKAGGVITGLATLKDIRYDDYKIARPNIGGFVSVEETVTLQVTIVARSEGET